MIEYGDPEPDRSKRYVDAHGDFWEWDALLARWTTPETAYFNWGDMKRSWFPMREVEK